jgi:hypothetical protein
MQFDDDRDPWLPWLGALGDAARVTAILENLWRFPFHTQRSLAAGNWDRLFACLLALHDHAESHIRDLAEHYLWIAIGEERGAGSAPAEVRAATAAARIRSLKPGLARRIERGESSALRSADALAHIEHLTDTGPLADVLAWLETRASSPAHALAARIAYLEGRSSPSSESIGFAQLVDVLDHPDALARAYAARALGRRYAEDEAGGDAPSLAEFVAFLTDKELARPGVAGPFLSNWYDHGLGEFEERAGVELTEWLCTILAHRQGAEPDLLPCSNGIDFFAHEQLAGNADALRRLIAMDRADLAVEAATEFDEPSEDLEPLLVELAAHADDEVSRIATWHLAAVYRHLHPAGAARGFVTRREFGERAELWVQRAPDGDGGLHAFAALAFPRAASSLGGAFDEAEATAILDALMPEAMRGALLPFGLAGDGGKPGRWVHGGAAHARYASGALVEFTGDVGAGAWSRLRILWKGAPGAWNP